MIPQFEWYWTVSVYEYICIVFALAVKVNKKWECRTMLIVSSVNHQHTQLRMIWLHHLMAYLNLKFHNNFTVTKIKLYTQFVIITVNTVYQYIDGLLKYIFIPATLECFSTKNHIWLSQITEESWWKMQVFICIVFKLVGGYWWCTAYWQINVPLKCYLIL